MAQASVSQTTVGQDQMARPGASTRLVSLDAFRGAIMALMVLVNTAGDYHYVYAPLRHSRWNGWTITDVVFPSFLWIVGLSLTLSLGKRVAQGASKSALMMQVLRRAAILYALGLVIYGFPYYHLGTLRLLGVLQRIAICYLIGALVFLTTRVRGQVLCIVALLAGYWMLMTLVPVPGYGAGNLTVEGNLAHYIDRIVLGAHNYAYTKDWDPEGIVSTLPAIATALFGILAGHVLRLKKDLSERTTWLLVAGNLLIALGLICDTWMPINKQLWTTSFSIFMAGLDCVMFGTFLWLVDGQGYKKIVRPLVIMGMNAIVVYMCSEMIDEVLNFIHWGAGPTTINLRTWIFRTWFAPLGSPINASLYYAIAYVLLNFAIAYVMYRKKWFVRV